MDSSLISHLVRRYRQPRMLCWHDVLVLRFDQAGCDFGALVAQWTPRLHNGEFHFLADNAALLTFEQPYMINMLSQQTATIALLKKDNEERKAREASQQKDEDSTPILGGSRLMLTQGPISNAPSPAPYANGIAPQATGFRAF